MRRGIELLSKNDLRALQSAMAAGKEIQLPREWADGSGRILASTRPADPVWSPAKMLLRLEAWGRGWHSSQYFASVADMTALWRKGTHT